MSRVIPDTSHIAEMVDVAMAWAEAGFAVFPCFPATKLPHSVLDPDGATPRGQGGFRLAGTDAAQIQAWWEAAPDAVPAVVPGSNGCVVIDVDGPSAKTRFWERAAQNGFDLYTTPVTITPGKGGGHHIWFDRSGHDGIAANTPLPGIGEQRGDNGYVLIPGARHPGGGRYILAKEEVVDVAVLPDWVVEVGWVSLNGHARLDASDVTDGEVARWLKAHSGTGGRESAAAAVDTLDELAALPMREREGERYPTMTRVVGRFLTEVQQGRSRVDIPAALNEIGSTYVSLYPPAEQPQQTVAFGEAAADFIRTRIAEDAEKASAEPWTPVDLTAVAASGLDPIEPDLLYRRDRRGLLYSAKLNVIFAAPEAGKTWIANFAIAQLVRDAARNGAGVVAVFIDYEDDARSYLTRLQSAGITPAEAATHTRYYSMAQAIRTAPDDLEGLDVAQLVVVDSTNSAMTLDNLDPLSNADALTFINHVRELRKGRSAAWLLLDHEPISTTKGRRQAIGAQSKLGAVDGAQYRAVAVEQPRPGAKGVIDLYVTKDRAGGVRQHAAAPKQDSIQHAATIVMEPRRRWMTGRFDWQILEPQGMEGANELRVAIIAACSDWVSKKEIQQRVRATNVKRRSTDITSMIEDLASEAVLATKPRGNYIVYKNTDARCSQPGTTPLAVRSSPPGTTPPPGTGDKRDQATVSRSSEDREGPGAGLPLPASRPLAGSPEGPGSTTELGIDQP